MKKNDKSNVPDPFRYKNIQISTHAQIRAKQRKILGSKAILAETAHKAVTEGMNLFLDPFWRPKVELAARNHNTDGVYVYRGVVFYFKEDTLATIIPACWVKSRKG